LVDWSYRFDRRQHFLRHRLPNSAQGASRPQALPRIRVRAVSSKLRQTILNFAAGGRPTEER
jgi:hypothetical protein